MVAEITNDAIDSELELARKIDGFPEGKSEVLFRLSNLPTMTSFPNTHLAEELNNINASKLSTTPVALPFEDDLSAGKEDPIYFAHYYSTKVPPHGIVPLLMHYTRPGDIVMDAFCGTGMTGVAAQLCEDPFLAASHKGTAGRRRAVLCDLSPTATFIASVTNRLASLADYLDEIDLQITTIEKQYRNFFQTRHVGWPRGATSKDRHNKETPTLDGQFGDIEYVVWSDVYTCPSCQTEISHWDLVFRGPGEPPPDRLECPSCKAELTTRQLERAWQEIYDFELRRVVRQVKQIPVLINYSIGKKRFEKFPDEKDIAAVTTLTTTALDYPPPIVELQIGFNTRQPRESHGFSHVHHFFSRRNLQLMSSYWTQIQKFDDKKYQIALYVMTGAIQRVCRLNRYMPNHDRHVGPLSGTLYVAPLVAEIPATSYMRERIKDLRRCTGRVTGSGVYVSTQSATCLRNIPDASIDYIFVDPPFGGNLNYSELNVLVEAWLGVKTAPKKEAIVNSSQAKDIHDYRHLMKDAFSEFYRVLKSNSWMTVEFHNSENAVWNSIQDALSSSGFVIANVRILDKQKGTTKQLSYSATVKHDLMISVYKPSESLTRKMASAMDANTLWDFVSEHLSKLPLVNKKGAESYAVAERQSSLIFDRVVAFCLRYGYMVPLSAAEFYAQLAARYRILDGMVFLSDQLQAYEKRKEKAGSVVQLTLFVQDEDSAIRWLRMALAEKPQTFQELQPDFMQEIRTWRKHEERPELSALLMDNFLMYDGIGDVPSPIHAYLSSNFRELRGLEKNNPRLIAKANDRWYVPDPNKIQDLEKKREKALLKEFDMYRSFTGRKLKEFRLDVMRAGFKSAWANKDYKTIIAIAQKLPEEALQEDEKLLLWYDQALTRMETGAG